MCSGCSGNYSDDYEDNSEQTANDAQCAPPGEMAGRSGRAERCPASFVPSTADERSDWAADFRSRQVQLPEEDEWEILVSSDRIIEVRRVRAVTPSRCEREGDAILEASAQVEPAGSGAKTQADYQRSAAWSAKYYGTQREFDFCEVREARDTSIRLLQHGLAALAALAAAGAVSWMILR